MAILKGMAPNLSEEQAAAVRQFHIDACSDKPVKPIKNLQEAFAVSENGEVLQDG